MPRTTSKLAATLALAILSILDLQSSTALAQGTAFTYQGRLDAGGAPASGIFDFRFAIFDSASGGAQVGGPLTNTATAVSNGLFTVTLDFGVGVFTGPARWLDISVRTNGGGAFITLVPRQPLTPSPYALYAPSAGVAASATTAATAASVAANGVANTSLQANAVTSAKIADGSVTAVDVAANTFWQTSGNAGTTAGTHFVGTTDPQPFELKVNNLRALRIEENGDGSDPGTTPDGAPNLIGGSPVNSVAPGVVGATISGGGATNFSGGTWPNLIDSDYSTVGGGVANTVAANSRYAAIGGGGFNSIAANAAASTVSGGVGNDIGVGSLYATVTGGYENDISSNAPTAVIGGGDYNKIGEQATAATIAGGRWNRVENGAPYASLGGGDENRVAGPYGTIPGGRFNYAVSYGFAAGRQAKSFHPGAFVWADSQAADFASTTSNQFNVRASGGARFITGGVGLTVDGQPVLTGQNGGALTNLNASQLSTGTVPAAALDNAWKIGGNAGTVPATHFLGTADNQPMELRINNQRALRLEPNAAQAPNVIGGYAGNQVPNGVVGATIAGGGAGIYFGNAYTNQPEAYTNRVLADFGTVGGGMANVASGLYTTVGGGTHNTASGLYATVGGGDNNTASGSGATVGGGDNNTASGLDATVGGGMYNVASFRYTTVGGGRNNIADGSAATVGGGWGNVASEALSTVGGGLFNVASGDYATIPGGYGNSATNYAFAAGHRAQAIHRGAFVWADYTAADFASTANNQFALRASGGVRIQSDPGIALNAADTPLITRGWDVFGSNAPAVKQGHGRWGLFMEPSRLVIGIPSNDIPNRFFSVAKYHTDGSYTALMTVDQNGAVTATSFTPLSDRHAKRNFQPVNPQEVLDMLAALPIHRWQFKDDTSEAWHVGPTAQDFHAAFGLGADDKHIATVDADGVALVAIQGLNQKLEARSQESEARIQKLEAENAALQQRLSQLEQLVRTLAASQNGGGQ